MQLKTANRLYTLAEDGLGVGFRMGAGPVVGLAVGVQTGAGPVVGRNDINVGLIVGFIEGITVNVGHTTGTKEGLAVGFWGDGTVGSSEMKIGGI